MTEAPQNNQIDNKPDRIDQDQITDQLVNLKEDIKEGFVKKLQQIPDIEDKLQKAFILLVEGKIPGVITKVLGFFGILKKVSSFLNEEENTSQGLSYVLIETILEGNKIGKYGLYVLLKKTLLEQFEGNDKQKLEDILSSLEKIRPAFKKTKDITEEDIQDEAYKKYLEQLQKTAQELKVLKDEITGTNPPQQPQNSSTPPSDL